MGEQFDSILQFAVTHGISDVHLRPDKPPVFRRHGKLVTQKGTPRLSDEHMRQLVAELVDGTYHRPILDDRLECDLSYGIPGVGRFRLNVFRQRGRHSIAVRVLSSSVPSFAELGLPRALAAIAEEHRGLVLVTGTTGSGKSTTLAAMLEHINASRPCHILTIEDPIEYVLEDKRAIVSQREISQDTRSFAEGLRGSLRQDPDVILIGEMRDLETIEAAMVAAETGHLVFSTLHTLDAAETINRVVVAFPPYHQEHVRRQLAGILRAVVSLRLMPRQDGKGRVPACEVLIATELVRTILTDPLRLRELREVMAKSFTSYGMQTFDQSIMMAYTAGHISYEEALRQASNPSDFALRVSGIAGGDQVDWDNFVLKAG
jgi:twitching motility protein PilT